MFKLLEHLNEGIEKPRYAKKVVPKSWIEDSQVWPIIVELYNVLVYVYCGIKGVVKRTTVHRPNRVFSEIMEYLTI